MPLNALLCTLLHFLWFLKCCGATSHGLTQGGVACCNNVLYADREHGEEWSDVSFPHLSSKGTLCCSQFHASPGEHCCGTEIFRPQNEVCCNGHR